MLQRSLNRNDFSFVPAVTGSSVPAHFVWGFFRISLFAVCTAICISIYETLHWLRSG